MLTLHYLNGNCSWRTVINIGGTFKEEELSLGPQLKIRGEGQIKKIDLKCVVDKTVLLHTVITQYGEITLTFVNELVDMSNNCFFI